MVTNAEGTARTPKDQEAFLHKVKEDFDTRLAHLASSPAQWVEFIEQAAEFGARYTLSNQFLLLMQAEERGITPRYFLPFGNKKGTSGWRKHHRIVRKGETAFKVWAPIRRRPTDEEAARWESEGRAVVREPSGRPAVQVVGFALSPTFELSQTDGEPFEVPTVRRLRRVRASAAGLPQLLSGDDSTGAFNDLVALIENAGYNFGLTAPGSGYLGTANGVTVGGDVMQVRVRDDISGAHRFKTTVHELAHIRFGHLTGMQNGENMHRGRRETEAESVAHLVCAALGLDSTAYSDAYVLGWADGDLDLVQQCAAGVLRVAKGILADLTPADATDGTASGEEAATSTGSTNSTGAGQ
ncbi:ArdC family protein [Actinoplanes sp. NPDC020271]|uniref:ArdC family protein n=1 Tax=Actinoplanes sp. NPDC020271 TaxID=3363896 RepID=UPI00378C954C